MRYQYFQDYITLEQHFGRGAGFTYQEYPATRMVMTELRKKVRDLVAYDREAAPWNEGLTLPVAA
jgi:hypothetical protein